MHYVIAVVEYTRQCGPLRLAKERVEFIKAEIADYERKRQERENEVRIVKANKILISIFNIGSIQLDTIKSNRPFN